MASPCAACKFLRRKCTNSCVFAPYFPPDQPTKFASVHKIFGASNVAKLLNDLPPHQREEAVNALSYEASARISDPVFGCVGRIQSLQDQIKQTEAELARAKKELSSYTGSMAYPSFLPQSHHLLAHNHSSAAMAASYMSGPYGVTNTGIGIDLGLATSVAMPPHSGVMFRDHQADVQQHLLAVETLAKEQNRVRFNAAIENIRGSYSGLLNANLTASMPSGGLELVSPQSAVQVQHHRPNTQPTVLQQQVTFDNVFLARPIQQPQVHHLQLQTQPQTHQPPQLQQEMQFFSNQLKQQQVQQHRRVSRDESRSTTTTTTCIRPDSLP